MQDEHFMREWTAGHSRFSADLDHAFRKAASALRRLINKMRRPNSKRDTHHTTTAPETPLACVDRIAAKTGVYEPIRCC
ncbi:hypothetical protein [Novosphingobium malaysiense]|uniref:Uncharacterized protein n=1 Tax=Novosphingobium malaysiense TaxID=1348853 RepID=A0A0B1ZPE4_9SPHN|nr:hypothetical protein [Novosphingobium malaysiense]KHK91052.1 hypothetical protein LK12_08995 [Novosphingobium malaysiense]